MSISGYRVEDGHAERVNGCHNSARTSSGIQAQVGGGKPRRSENEELAQRTAAKALAVTKTPIRDGARDGVSSSAKN